MKILAAKYQHGKNNNSDVYFFLEKKLNLKKSAFASPENFDVISSRIKNGLKEST